MTRSAAYQFTGICPRYVAPPPVAAARATDLPEELLAMAGGNPTAWRHALRRQAHLEAGRDRERRSGGADGRAAPDRPAVPASRRQGQPPRLRRSGAVPWCESAVP